MTGEERQEARVALTHVYNMMERVGYYGDRMIAGYLEEGGPSYAAVEAIARGNNGKVGREDMLTELLISYFEKKTGGVWQDAGEMLMFVYNVMDKVGYDPIAQLVGYLLFDDPSYITTKENARNTIRRIERYDLILELVTSYFE